MNLPKPGDVTVVFAVHLRLCSVAQDLISS